MARSDHYDERHWTNEDYRQRMTTKQWREILLDNDDKIIFRGTVMNLKAKSLGHGVVEVFKEPLPL